jgi:hypothetical protein
MEKWTEVRRRVLTGELSKRAACREYGINWRTLVKMLTHAEPPSDGRNAQFRCSRAVGQPEDRCGRAIDRAILCQWVLDVTVAIGLVWFALNANIPRRWRLATIWVMPAVALASLAIGRS